MNRIQTPSGDKNIFELSYGDLVYNIHGHLSRVIGDKYYNKAMIYKLQYSDGRSNLHSINDLIYTKSGRIPLRHLIQRFYPYEVPLHEVKYRDKIKIAMDPDPYITGALLTYGDFTQENMNLPLSLTIANPYFSNKYHIEHAAVMVNDLVMYQRIGSDTIITWKDFFGNKLDHDFYTNTILPLYIRRSSINNRYQFIRGAFDLGFNKDIFMESECGIGNKDFKRLEMIQSILWSLGIKSEISPIEKLNVYGWNYRLKVNERMERFVSLFYHIRKIERMVINRTTVIKYPMPVPKLELAEISVEGESSYRELILDKPSVMLDEKFLPRISL